MRRPFPIKTRSTHLAHTHTQKQNKKEEEEEEERWQLISHPHSPAKKHNDNNKPSGAGKENNNNNNICYFIFFYLLHNCHPLSILEFMPKRFAHEIPLFPPFKRTKFLSILHDTAQYHNFLTSFKFCISQGKIVSFRRFARSPVWSIFPARQLLISFFFFFFFIFLKLFMLRGMCVAGITCY